MSYFADLVVNLAIAVMVALSLNIIIGYCGLLSLAHAGYFAVGAYAYAITTTQLGWNPLEAMALGMGLAAILSLAISLPAWRFKGDFFVMISLAVQVLLFSLFYNWYAEGSHFGTAANLTNGAYGIPGIPKPGFFGLTIHTPPQMAAYAVTLAGLCALLLRLLLRSPFGRLLKSMRDDELAVRALGKNVRLAKVQALAIACAMAALAGAVYASYMSYVDPSAAGLDQSILMLAMVILGGAGNLTGPVVGAVVLVAIPEALRFAHVSDAVAPNIRLGVFGILLVVLMHFRPQGLAGEYRME